MRILFQHAGEWRPADEKLVKAALADASAGTPQAAAPASILLGQTVEQLQDLVSGQFEQPKYRGKQLYDALFHGVTAVHDAKQVCLFLRMSPNRVVVIHL